MDRTRYVEVRPNIWLNKDDPSYEQKFKEYSTKVRNVGHLVEADSPEDIKRATQTAEDFTETINANTVPTIVTTNEPPRRRRVQQKSKFSFFDWLTAWVQAGILLGIIIGIVFVTFYIFIRGLL